MDNFIRGYWLLTEITYFHVCFSPSVSLLVPQSTNNKSRLKPRYRLCHIVCVLLEPLYLLFNNPPRHQYNMENQDKFPNKNKENTHQNLPFHNSFFSSPKIFFRVRTSIYEIHDLRLIGVEGALL